MANRQHPTHGRTRRLGTRANPLLRRPQNETAHARCTEGHARHRSRGGAREREAHTRRQATEGPHAIKRSYARGLHAIPIAATCRCAHTAQRQRRAPCRPRLGAGLPLLVALRGVHWQQQQCSATRAPNDAVGAARQRQGSHSPARPPPSTMLHANKAPGSPVSTQDCSRRASSTAGRQASGMHASVALLGSHCQRGSQCQRGTIARLSAVAHHAWHAWHALLCLAQQLAQLRLLLWRAPHCKALLHHATAAHAQGSKQQRNACQNTASDARCCLHTACICCCTTAQRTAAHLRCAGPRRPHATIAAGHPSARLLLLLQVLPCLCSRSTHGC